MDRINLFSFYQLGYALHPVTFLKDQMTFGRLNQWTSQLRPMLETLMEGKPVELRNKAPVEELVQAIKNATPKQEEEGFAGYVKSLEQEVLAFHVQSIAHAAAKFEVVLSNDFPIFHSYLIPEHGLHSVDTLINNPERAFEESMVEHLGKLIGEPLVDFRESARCLAFGFSTACGFHVVRSAEAVLRNWYKSADPKAEFETEWKGCIDGIRSKNKNNKNEEHKAQVAAILNVLDQIRETHRNPLMHPEVTLDENEAQFLFDLVKSAIFSMMKQIPGLELKKASP